MMYRILTRYFLFQLDAERAHYTTFFLLKIFSLLGLSKLYNALFVPKSLVLEKNLMGLKFSNPIGLAAGMDKNAELCQSFHDVGFGFVEIGTLTPKPQAGNPKKRLFRLLSDEGIINRMGFNNEGVEKAVRRLQKNRNFIIGGNIGKNKTTPNENALEDYLICLRALYNVVDYFVVNVSSPNTPGLRELQEKEPLTRLLTNLKAEGSCLAKSFEVAEKPILLKLAPDLSDAQLMDIIEIVESTDIAGIIATNTTISREGIDLKQKYANESGGLSGRPLCDRSTEVIKFISTHKRKPFVIVGVGGIHSAESALEKLRAGADLIQIYSGLVYEGPGLISSILKELKKESM